MLFTPCRRSCAWHPTKGRGDEEKKKERVLPVPVCPALPAMMVFVCVGASVALVVLACRGHRQFHRTSCYKVRGLEIRDVCPTLALAAVCCSAGGVYAEFLLVSKRRWMGGFHPVSANFTSPDTKSTAVLIVYTHIYDD